MKTKPDNDVINHMSLVYAKNDIELSWPIKSGADNDENHIGQLHEWLYRCGPFQKQNWVVVINQITYIMWLKPNRTTTWPIV